MKAELMTTCAELGCAQLRRHADGVGLRRLLSVANIKLMQTSSATTLCGVVAVLMIVLACACGCSKAEDGPKSADLSATVSRLLSEKKYEEALFHLFELEKREREGIRLDPEIAIHLKNLQISK